ncbi:MAG TPA: hypothetical protein QF873_03270 [Patescibacteria group bacterium]|nr:hypothetical protein [Patescibacteria group bacterium]
MTKIRKYIVIVLSLLILVAAGYLAYSELRSMQLDDIPNGDHLVDYGGARACRSNLPDHPIVLGEAVYGAEGGGGERYFTPDGVFIDRTIYCAPMGFGGHLGCEDEPLTKLKVSDCKAIDKDYFTNAMGR